MSNTDTPVYTQFTPPPPGNGQVTDYQKVKLPMPRVFNGKTNSPKKELQNASACAKILLGKITAKEGVSHLLSIH